MLLSGISFRVVAAVLQMLRIWETVFYPQTFLTFHSFPTFDARTATICFYQGFSGRRQFFLENFRTYHCDSKHATSSSVCLNRTVFSKLYYLVGSIYVLRSAAEHYINLLLILNPLSDSSICFQSQVLSTRSQNFLVSYGL